MTEDIREEIKKGTLLEFRDEFINNYVKNNSIIISLTDEEIIESIWDDF